MTSIEDQESVTPLVLKLILSGDQGQDYDRPLSPTLRHYLGVKMPQLYSSYITRKHLLSFLPIHVTCDLSLIFVADEALTVSLNKNGLYFYGWDLIHRAVHLNRQSVVHLLLDGGASVHSRDPAGFTLLHCAAQRGHTGLVELLLNQGADPDVRNGEEQTPLCYAIANGESETAELLLDHGTLKNDLVDGKVARSPFLWAAYRHELALMIRLIELRSDVNSSNNEGEGALHYAASEDAEEILVELLVRGANPDIATNWGEVPIEYAMMNGRRVMALILLLYGAQVVGLSSELLEWVHKNVIPIDGPSVGVAEG
jgi:hypothetical protein